MPKSAGFMGFLHYCTDLGAAVRVRWHKRQAYSFYGKVTGAAVLRKSNVVS